MKTNFDSLKNMDLTSWNEKIYGGTKEPLHIYLNNVKVPLSSKQIEAIKLFRALSSRTYDEYRIPCPKLKMFGIDCKLDYIIRSAYRQLERSELHSMEAACVTLEKVEFFMNNYIVEKVADIEEDGTALELIRLTYKDFSMYFIGNQDTELDREELEYIQEEYNIIL